MQSINLSALLRLFKISLVFAVPYILTLAGICSFNFLAVISEKETSVTADRFLWDLFDLDGLYNSQSSTYKLD